MLPIQEVFFPVNQFSRPGTKITVKGIVMHYTASKGAPAKNIENYFAGLRHQNPNDNVDDRYASAQFSVDDNSIYAGIPYKKGVAEMAYHVGSKSYTGEALKRLGSYPNNCTLGVEMCIDENGRITEKTFQNSADLVAFLCKMHGLDENDIWTHKGVVGWKDCPLPWVQKPSEFTRFKAEVAKRLRPAAKPAPKPVAPKPASKPAPSGIKAVGTIKIVRVGIAAIICDKPSTKSKNLGVIGLGKTIKISGSVPGWWEVVYNGERAYINAKYGERV